MVTVWHLLYFWSIFVPLLSGILSGLPMGMRGVLLGLVVGSLLGYVAFSGLRATLRRCGACNLSGFVAFGLLLAASIGTDLLTGFLLHRHAA